MPGLLQTIRRSVSVKLLILFVLVLTVTVVVILIPVRAQMHAQIIDDLRTELRAIAVTAAMHIDGDLLATVRRATDAETPAFARLRAQLRGIRDINDELNQDNIYTVFRDGDGVLRFGVMTHPQPFVGDECPAQPEIKIALETGTPQVTSLYTDENGQWISAFCPIFDSAGAVVGALDVNRRSERYFARYHLVTRLTIGLGLLALASSAMLGWLVLNRVVMRPMRAVQNGMQALRRSEFAHRVELRTGDEFQLLGDTFNRLARELNAARSVQASFAPRDIPSRHGWAIAAASEPCDATAGDYVDAFELPGDRIAVVVADVAGHGLGPALLMSACRSTLRALSTLDLSPTQVVDRLDAMICADLTEGRFITMIFGILEADGRFTFCNAGHGPAMAILNGRPQTLHAHRPPVGVDFKCEDGSGVACVTLKAGDRLLLASDGVTEAFDADGQQFGEVRLTSIACDQSVGRDALVGAVLGAVRLHRGSRPQSDDITILCVDRAPDAAATACQSE